MGQSANNSALLHDDKGDAICQRRLLVPNAAGADSAGCPQSQPLETSREKLVRGSMDGFGAVYTALGLAIPQLVEIITSFVGNQA